MHDEIQILEDVEEPEWESPHGSRWIIAVTQERRIVVLSIPGIHYSFTDEGTDAEFLFGTDKAEEYEPGIYEWICDLETSTDWETGYIDDMYFYPVEINLLYGWNDGKVNEGGNETTQSNSGSD